MEIQIPTDRVVSTDRRFLSRDQASAELLSVVDVPAEWGQYVRVLDRQGPLALLHYVNTCVSASDQTIDEAPLKVIGHVRGIIVNTDTKEIVCRSFPYTPEVVSNEPERAQSLLPEDLSNVSFYNACEGTVLRLFWAGDEWRISTHRKVDAHNSYWAGPTFGSLFQELREGNFEFEDLDKNLCYVFLMSHNSNRLVYSIPKPQLMLITIYNRSEARFLATTEYGPDFEEARLNPPGCVYPQPVEGIKTLSDLQEAVESLEDEATFNSAGIIALADSANPHPIKMMNESYSSLRDARGNDPNLRARYIQLRGTPEGGLVVGWFTEPSYQEVFDAAEDEVDTLIERLHDMYMNRYVHKDFSELPKEEFVTLQRCHSWHVSDRSKNKVTEDKVREVLNGTPNHFLLMMLNRQRREQREAEREAVSENKE